MKISRSEKMIIVMVLKDYATNILSLDKVKKSNQVEKLNNFRNGILHIIERFEQSI